MKKKLTLKNVIIIIITITVLYFIGSFAITKGELRKYVSPNYEVSKITVNDIQKLKKNMTYLEILKILGKTKDIGNTKPMAKYKVGDKYLYIAFIYIHDKSIVTAEGYIDSLTTKDFK